MLEDMVKSGELNTPDDRFDLAQLYLAQGEWLKYCQQMRRVLAADPPKPRHMAAYVRALLQHNESAEAELWLVRLEKASPDQLLTVGLRADVLARNNRFSQAVETLMGFPDRPNAMPKGHWERVMLVAGALERLASGAAERGQKAAAVLFTEKADELFRAYNVQQPGNEMVLAGFLARQGRVKEALQLIERFWSSAKPEALAQAALDLIHGGSAGPEQIRQLQRVLTAALKKFNRPACLLMTMADACTHEEQYQEAEEYYREAAAKRDFSAIALNNLGMLLAIRGRKLDDSLQLINQAIELAGPMAPMLDTRGVIYISMGDADKALADITMALNEDPTPVRIFHQSRAYLLAGRKIEASAALQAAVRKGLKRLMLDPPERPIFDKLRTEL
jgi:tetratricopeptide (TPR) repeat protein